MPLRIGIAGAGVAGLAAAIFLARAGHDVTVIDQFAAPAPLGSGLMIQPVGLAVLKALGLEGDITARASPIDRLLGQVVPSGRTVLDVRYRAGQRGFGVQRGALFSVLLQAAQGAGARLVTGAPIARADQGAGVTLSGPAGNHGPFDLVVDALGARSVLCPRPAPPLAYGALWALLDWPERGFDPAMLTQRYFRASRMVGVLPVGRAEPGAPLKATFFWSLRSADRPTWSARGLAPWRAEVAALWPQALGLAEQITAPEQLIWAQYAHRTLGHPVSGRIAHLGDSYHATSPQLGQGANMALLDATALALALGAQSDLDAALALYARLRRRHVWLYQLLSWMFTPAYQSDSRVLPVVRDWLMGPVSGLWPAPQILSALVSGTLGGPLGPLGLRL